MTTPTASGAALETVILYTRRPEVLAHFYARGLELPPFEHSAPKHWGQPVGPVYLGIDEVEDVPDDYPGAVHLWFTVDDLETTFERFTELGAPVRFPPGDRPWGARLAAVYDPDGNIVGLSQRGGG